MRIIDPIRISYKNLLAAKFRSFLTILGIIIGVASVILIMSIGQSAQALILDQVSGIGSNLIGVLPGASDQNGPPAAAMGIKVTTLKYDDLQALRDGEHVPEISDAAGYVMGSETAKYNGNSIVASFTGTTASYVDVENAEVDEGRFFTKDEETNMAKVAVVGENIVRDLLNGDDPVQAHLARTIDDAHPAAPQLGQDFVAVCELRPDHVGPTFLMRLRLMRRMIREFLGRYMGGISREGTHALRRLSYLLRNPLSFFFSIRTGAPRSGRGGSP